MNSSVTQRIVDMAGDQLSLQWEHATQGPYHCFSSGSVETEVGDFLYALVRMVKPRRILETGTHLGVSSAYMGMALFDENAGWTRDEQSGRLVTCEIEPSHAASATKLWSTLGITPYITQHMGPSLQYVPPAPVDLLFLDSEPQFRFDEFVRFWPMVQPGGFILIHDLHPGLHHTGTTVHGMVDWPFGDFREKLGPYIKRHDVQTISFRTPRGFTLFQKAAPDFAFTQHLQGVI